MANKIKESNISDGAVTSNKIAPGTIAADRLAGSITNDQLAGSIANAKLANSSITINGTSIALGASGDIVAGTDWQSVITADGSTTTTSVAGEGYFIDTTSNAHTINLPASPSLGDQVTISDVAGTFGTNNVTVGRNSSKINGESSDLTLNGSDTQRTFAYSGSTYGWIDVNSDGLTPTFIEATGGTTTTSGNFRIHTFTSSSNFVVSSESNTAPNNEVSYLVIAGGGAGGRGASDSGNGAGGGGAGGYREGKAANDTTYTASPLVAPSGLTVTAQTYPITVGAGGSTVPWPSPSGTNHAASLNEGNNSVFSTITSAKGGGGGNRSSSPGGAGGVGGSGGGSVGGGAGAAGNTPPVSPPQGNPGGTTTGPFQNSGSGGGGAGVAGSGVPGSGEIGGAGGAGSPTNITGSDVTRAGGGGGGGSTNNGGSPGPGAGGAGGSGGGGTGADDDSSNATAGSANTGGGGGAGSGSDPGSPGANGGSGIVIIRYKYQ